MKQQQCDERNDLPYPLALIQNGRNRFTVRYGLQIKRGLTYSEAAKEYGACLMHALALQGKLSNE
jgi:hypothetical protein